MIRVNNYIYFVIIFLCGLTKGSRWACFTCSATNKELCESVQIKQKCLPHMDMCLTLEYEETLQLTSNKIKIINHYEKRCAKKSKGCDYYCQEFRAMGNTCKQTCCYTKLCNIEKEEEKSRNKRNYYNASTTIVTSSIWITLTIFCLITISVLQ